MALLTRFGGVVGYEPRTVGRIYFVAPSASYTVDGRTHQASNDNDGLHPERAIRDLNRFNTLATANAGDVAVMLPGTHTVTATQTISGAQLLIQGGTTPGISFAGDTNTGVGNNNAADRLALYTDGAVRTLVGTSWVQMLVQLEATIGSSSFPGYSFRTDINTGMFGLDNDILAFATNSTERERIDTNGNHSLGTTATPATGTKALTVASGTAVAAAVTDAFSLYSADMAGAAGKAWPHIYGEDTTNGALVVGVGAASQLAYWTANNVIASGSATITHAGIVNFVVGGTPPSANATTVISAVNCSASGDLARIRIISGSAGQSILEMGDSADTDIGAIVYDHGTDAWSVRTNNVSNRLVVSGSGNVGVAVTTFGTSASTVFAIGEGVAPTTAPANMVQMWSADVNAAAGYNGLHKRTETTNVVEVVPGVTIKGDTGRTANPYEGLMEINTFDNLIAMYADAGWRTLASGW